PVTATETSVAGASSSCSCTTTNTVTVDPEPVTVTVTSTSSPVGVNAADVTSPAAGVSTPVAMPSVDSAVAGVSSMPVPAASSPAAMPVVSDAAVGGAPTPVASSPAAVSTAAAVSTPAAAASSPAASSAAGLVGGLTDTAGSAASDAVEAIGEAVSGTATYYTYGTDLSQGTCSFSGYTLPSSIFGTALSDSDWASAGNCGACIKVTGPQQNSIVAMIVDQCPGCGDHHLDLFQDAFTELDSLSTGRINVDWEFVPCGITSGISLLNKDGASEYWFSMQVQNSNLPVESLEVSVDGGKTWTNTTRTEYNYFEHESGFGQATVDVRITSKTGVKVEAKGVTVSSLSSHDVGDNFSS
ncbi:RlpA-like double-psi beta-barrel-protein domain-containing protein-containing protein, partial [Phyllosticta citriasiana]